MTSQYVPLGGDKKPNGPQSEYVQLPKPSGSTAGTSTFGASGGGGSATSSYGGIPKTGGGGIGSGAGVSAYGGIPAAPAMRGGGGSATESSTRTAVMGGVSQFGAVPAAGSSQMGAEEGQQEAAGGLSQMG